MKQEQSASVMIVSTTDKALGFFQKILPKDQFYPLTWVHSAGEAQRELVNKSVDIVVINAPLKDEMGTELAIELAQNNSCGVMMMVKNDVYEQVSYKVEEYGVLTLPRPCTAQQAFQTMKQSDSRKIGAALIKLGWRKGSDAEKRKCGPYGTQRVYFNPDVKQP